MLKAPLRAQLAPLAPIAPALGCRKREYAHQATFAARRLLARSISSNLALLASSVKLGRTQSAALTEPGAPRAPQRVLQRLGTSPLRSLAEMECDAKLHPLTRWSS